MKMKRPTTIRCLVFAMALAAVPVQCLVGQASQPGVDVNGRIQLARTNAPHNAVPAALPASAVWLKPLTPGIVLPLSVAPRGGYTLLQKNKMFVPHLLVVPTGSVVMFPNADPFFHNVFSLFDGQRFDLGLYEAGKTRAVNFSREGVSYIFCNIHSEMSAVVIALTTPLYSVAARDGTFVIHGVPEGDYEMHLWIEGEPQAVLDRWVRRVRISRASADLGTITVDSAPAARQHANKFGQPYDPDKTSTY
jgi:hypothetical protein